MVELSEIIGNENPEPLPGEEFRDILGYDGIYTVSNYGRVRSERREHNLNGYIKEKIRRIQYKFRMAPCVLLYRNNKPQNHIVARLVAETFMRDIAEGECAMHINKNPMDNRLENIRIATISESCKVNYDFGLIDDALKKAGNLAYNLSDRRNIALEGKQRCSKCGEIKELNDFYKWTTGRNKVTSHCKSCMLEGQKQRRSRRRIADA